MATRLERAQETLKREEKKSDLKRLKEARSHLQAAFAFVKAPIHDTEIETYVDTIRTPIAQMAEQLRHVALSESLNGQPMRPTDNLQEEPPSEQQNELPDC